jgi:type IV secretory pathway VirB10-like protein
MPLGYVLLLGLGALMLWSRKAEAAKDSPLPTPRPGMPKPEAPKQDEPKPDEPKPEPPKEDEPKPEPPKQDEPKPEPPQAEENVERAPDAWLKKGLAQASLARVRYKRADGKLHIYEITSPLGLGNLCEAIDLLNAVEDGFYLNDDCKRVKSDVPLEVLLDDDTSLAIVRPKGEPLGDKRTKSGKWFIITSTGENRIE